MSWFTVFTFCLSFNLSIVYAQDALSPPQISTTTDTESHLDFVSTKADSDFAGETMYPADVMMQVNLIRDEIELIRAEMGRPWNRQPQVYVSNASPHEVFYQALTLFQKANRLSFELTRTRAEEPEIPSSHLITTSHVWHLVDSALKRISVVKKELGIKKYSEQAQRDTTTISTDVFRGIVQANRQLNLLLERQFSSSDTYQEITLAISYASRLLEEFPGLSVHEAPEYEGEKRPRDVYFRIARCFTLVRKIAKRSGFNVVELDPGNPQEVMPSDSYDLASLVVSALSHLHAKANHLDPPIGSYFPGRKFPSHTYQRTGILEAQLEELLKLVKASPNWLEGGVS